MKKLFLYLMCLFYIAAGINHFINTGMYIRIMPPWLPQHELLVLLSGIAELLLGILLLFPRTRRLAAWGIIILLIAVFPANIQMMLDYRAKHHPQFWVTIVRLPVQFLLIWWAYQYAGRRKQEVGGRR